jgi:CO/xanthine dehydrogenase Mo-binding subunit
MSKANIIGPARNRVDGLLKVTGRAKYAVEFEVPQCAHAWPVVSNIAKGSITSIDTGAAESASGVLKVLTHQNAQPPQEAEGGGGKARRHGIRIEERNPLGDEKVYYAGQYVALVVAETLEQAQYAASLVRVNYAPEEPVLFLDAAKQKTKEPKKNQDEDVQPKKGDVEAALQSSDLVRIEETYITPTETHNPIEMSGTIAGCDPVRERRAEHSRAHLQSRSRKRARDRSIRRRSLWLQGRGLAARTARGDGGEGRRPARQFSCPAQRDVHFGRSSYADAPDDCARREQGRKAAGHASRE